MGWRLSGRGWSRCSRTVGSRWSRVEFPDGTPSATVSECVISQSIERFGSLLNLNCHFHSLQPDGVLVTS